MKNRVLIFLLACSNFFVASAQEMTLLDSLIKTNKYDFTFNGNQFKGDGMDYILSQSENAQFVGIAENHNVKEIPLFTSFLFDQLAENYQFNYLALEQDPVMMQLLSQRKYEAVEIAKKYPHGFTFISDQELGLIAHVITRSDKINSGWGCDQSFGASHALNEIVLGLRKQKMNTEGLDQLLKSVYEKELKRDLGKGIHYLSEIDEPKEFLSVKEIIDQKHSEDLSFYIESLIKSDSIYSHIVNEEFFEGRSMRENYMKSRFIEEYKKALTNDPLPKVLLKFGHFHLMDGFNRGTLVTNVGNLTKHIAQYNGKESLLINTQVYRNDQSEWDYFEDSYPNFAKHAEVNSYTLFDLRPLRASFYNGLLQDLVADKARRSFTQLIFSFDLLIAVGNGGDATWEVTGVDY